MTHRSERARLREVRALTRLKRTAWATAYYVGDELDYLKHLAERGLLEMRQSPRKKGVTEFRLKNGGGT